MKSITTTLLFILAGGITFGQVKTPSAEIIMQHALTEATGTHKNVFIIFHASWCGWCHKMDDAIADEKLHPFFDSNYIIVHLTVDESRDKKELENPGAVQLRTKYHGDQQGLPYWFILDSKGNFLADSRLQTRNMAATGNSVNVGCPSSNEEVNYFLKVLRKTSSLSEKQLVLIQERFLQP